MIGTLNRATRRKLDRRAKQLFVRIEERTARRELVQLARRYGGKFACRGRLAGGADFAVSFSPDGVTWGEKEQDGFCAFVAYGPDGEHMFDWGGDGLDLLEEVALNGAGA